MPPTLTLDDILPRDAFDRVLDAVEQQVARGSIYNLYRLLPAADVRRVKKAVGASPTVATVAVVLAPYRAGLAAAVAAARGRLWDWQTVPSVPSTGCSPVEWYGKWYSAAILAAAAAISPAAACPTCTLL